MKNKKLSLSLIISIVVGIICVITSGLEVKSQVNLFIWELHLPFKMYVALYYPLILFIMSFVCMSAHQYTRKLEDDFRCIIKINNLLMGSMYSIMLGFVFGFMVLVLFSLVLLPTFNSISLESKFLMGFFVGLLQVPLMFLVFLIFIAIKKTISFISFLKYKLTFFKKVYLKQL